MNQPEIERLVRVEVIMDEMRNDLKELIGKVDTRFDKIDARVKATEDTIKNITIGGRVLWVAGAVIATISSAVGGLVVKFLPLFSSLPK